MQTTLNDSSSQRSAGREVGNRRYSASLPLGDAAAGARVSETVRHRLADGAERIVLTSADHDLPRDVVEHAFDALRYSGLVCATASDGAIVLLGMTQLDDALLAGVPWGTADALTELLRAARERHVPLVILPGPTTESRARG